MRKSQSWLTYKFQQTYADFFKTLQTASGADMSGGKCPEDRGSKEGRPGGHLYARLSSASSLHVGLRQDRSSAQVGRLGVALQAGVE